MFEAFVKQGKDGRGSGLTRRVMFMVSFALHGALLCGAVFHSFWNVDELSPPAVTVTFISAMVAPPPPPPPPAAAARVEKAEKPRAKKPTPEPTAIVQPTPEPVVQPPEVKPEPAEATETAEAGPAEAAPGAVAGGVEGGVAGGVLGRVAPPRRRRRPGR